MSIQWYPGHMTKARRELVGLIPSQDVIIEVLDARFPAASSNPVLTELRGAKPCIKVLTKSDLADPEVTKAWLEHFETKVLAREQGRVLAFASTTERAHEVRTRIPELCKKLGLKHSSTKPLRALITGIPNVGKSTLINTLMDRVVAVVGDKPAVTKAQQMVVLKNGMVLSDSPGLLWPKIEDESIAFRLALGGSIPDTAIDYLHIAMFAAGLLLERYASLVVARYKLREVPAAPELLLEEIGRRRGCLRSGGIIDLHKASEILVHELRTGVLGRVSLETPSDVAAIEIEPTIDDPTVLQ